MTPHKAAHREKAAFHEAGHALMNYLQGIRFRRVTIIPGEDYLGKVVGFPSPVLTLENADYLVGPDAQTFLCGLAASFMAGEVSEGTNTQAAVDRGGCYLDAVRVYLMSAAGGNPDMAGVLWGEVETRVEQTLKENKGAVAALAKALMDRDSLTEADACEVMAGALPGSVVASIPERRREWRLLRRRLHRQLDWRRPPPWATGNTT